KMTQAERHCERPCGAAPAGAPLAALVGAADSTAQHPWSLAASARRGPQRQRGGSLTCRAGVWTHTPHVVVLGGHDCSHLPTSRSRPCASHRRCAAKRRWAGLMASTPALAEGRGPITLDLYSHVSLELGKKAAADLNAALTRMG